MTKQKNAISPTRQQDFAEWYQQVIKASEMAENSPVRGCMVIRPWGYGVWENIQKQLDQRIKATGHENAYFPLFIPLSFLEKEAAHVDGFAKECAVVTHHRLEAKDGRLVPASPLEEPLIVRPTSETIIGESYAKWVESYRDLPLLINQWANVVRWEMRPRIFLRTSEFLWQEGHTVHATAEEAMNETLTMLKVYQEFVENVLAIPVIIGEKSAGERFPGAVSTYTLEAMMQDGKALQGGTSHYLGQNFAKASQIRFTNKEGVLQYAYTTSWGMTTRTIGAMIMCHGDDDGLRVPPRVAPKQIVILPITPTPDSEEKVWAFADQVAKQLKEKMFHGENLTVLVDKRERRGGEKNWEWIKKGVPLRIEIGPKEVDGQEIVMCRRDKPHQEKVKMKAQEFALSVDAILDEIQANYFKEATQFRDQRLHHDLKSFDEFKQFFLSAQEGFVIGKWCGDSASEQMLNEADLKVSIRCLPINQSNTEGKCILTGKPATQDAVFARSY